MQTNQTDEHEHLPERLQAQFAEVKRRLWLVESAVACVLVFIAATLSFLAVYFLDRMWDTPNWARLLLLLGFLGCAIHALGKWFFNWVIRRRDQKYLAKLVQNRFNRLGDRLLSVVELADEEKHPAGYSRALYHAAIEQVGHEAEKYDFTETVSTTGVRRMGFLAGALLVTVVVIALATPDAALNSLQRWSAPTSKVERRTLVKVTRLPDELIVPHGESFRVRGSVEYSTFWKPSRVEIRIPGSITIEGEVADGQFDLELPGLTAPNIVEVAVGDGSGTTSIRPEHRPALREMTAQVEMPGYLHYDAQTNEVRGGSLRHLRGSHVSLRARLTKDIAKASLRNDSGAGLPVGIDGPRLKTELLEADSLLSLTFAWEDHLGLTNAAPWTLTFSPFEDQPPMPQIVKLPRAVSILETEVLDVKVQSRDDFGIQQTGIALRLPDDPDTEVEKSNLIHTASTHAETDLENLFEISPALLGVPPGEILGFQAWTTDRFPGRSRVYTPMYQLLVVSLEDHAEMIRQRMENLLTQLEEVSRAEETIANDTSELAESDEDQLNSGDKREPIEDVAKRQGENAETLEQLAQDGMRALVDALRNPALDDSTISEWTETLSNMNALAQQSMQQAKSQLSSAASSPSQAQEKLEEARETEEQIMDELANMQQQVNEDLDRMQALTLSQRLKQIGDREGAIVSDLQRHVQSSIGLRPEDLSSNYRSINAELATTQGVTRDTTVELEAEISRFAERTQMTNYIDVSREIRDKETIDALEDISSLIDANRGLQSMRGLSNWQTQFHEWSDRLKPPKREEESGSGQGSGGSQGSPLEMLIQLMRTREGETNLRRQTQLLNREEIVGDAFSNQAARLSELQSQIREGFGRVIIENPMEALEPILGETDRSMIQVRDLLEQPRVDAVTDGAQKSTIDLLTDTINLVNELSQQGESESSPSQQQSRAEQMAFLMQMAGQQQSESPGGQMPPQAGGNFSGGDTTDRADGIEGDATGRGEDRASERSAGTTREHPAEFRQALENYFRGVEESEASQ